MPLDGSFGTLMTFNEYGESMAVDFQYHIGENHTIEMLHSFRSGEITAILGTSGAGKSSVLNVISGKVSEEKIEGGVYLIHPNEVTQMNTKYWGSGLKMVDQVDDLDYRDTVQNSLEFYASIIKCDDRSEERMDEIIRAFHLSDCMDVQIGDKQTKGISGGQKRRLAVARYLLSNPSILLLDEPTSGLDSRMSLELLQCLKSISNGRKIILTIHQPSAEVCELIDTFIVMHKGKVYCKGTLPEMQSFCEQMGYPSGGKKFFLDYILDVPKMLSDEEFNTWCDKIKNDEEHMFLREEISQSAGFTSHSVENWSITRSCKIFFQEFRLALSSSFPDVFIALVVITIFCGVCWFGYGNSKNAYEQDLLGTGLLLVCTALCTDISKTTMNTRQVVLEEVENKIYFVSEYYFGVLLSTMIQGFIVCSVFTLISFFMFDIQIEFHEYWLTCLLSSYCAMAETLSVVSMSQTYQQLELGLTLRLALSFVILMIRDPPTWVSYIVPTQISKNMYMGYWAEENVNEWLIAICSWIVFYYTISFILFKIYLIRSY